MGLTGYDYEAELRRPDREKEQRIWLADLVDRLSGCRVAKCRELHYWNHPELEPHLRVEGYYCCYQFIDHSGYPQYAMIGRSRTSELLDLEQIIDELRSEELVFPFERFGEYYPQRKRKTEPGECATVRFGSRWYMLSVCGQLRPYFKLVANRQPIPCNPLTLREFIALSNASPPKDGVKGRSLFGRIPGP